MGIFDKLLMTEEEKEQARQLNQIGYINALNTHNWELQQKVLMLTAANEELHKQAEINGRLLTENAELRVENETLRRDVKTAVMGDSAELQDVKRENEKMRKALKPFAYYASQIPDDVSDTCSASGTVGDLRAAAAALEDK